MFYSHEVLTSRKYGVATVWVVATLGSKSALKKVSRKAILDVDVHKACETIIGPGAPLALRLQSNLLFGVASVYSQQCGYVLNDADAVIRDMRLLLKVIHDAGLNAEAENQGRPDQLILQDDPNFLADLDILPLDIDRMELDLTTMNEESQRSTLSPLTSQARSFASSSQADLGGLVIPGSASSMISGGGAGSMGGLRGFSARGDSSAGTRGNIGGLDDDLGLAIEEDGTLRMADELRHETPSVVLRDRNAGVGSVGDVVGGGPTGQDVLGEPDDDGFLPLYDDDAYIGPPVRSPTAARGEEEEEPQPQIETSEETADAPLQRQPRTKHKIVPLDDAMEIQNRVVSAWGKKYLTNMNDMIRVKNAHKATALAKKNAKFWMHDVHLSGPLSIFSGAHLLAAVTDLNARGFARKRSSSDAGLDEEHEEDDRRVRPRSSSHEIGRGGGEALQDTNDDGYQAPIFDSDHLDDRPIEQGRAAPTPLADRHASSIMPWNASADSRRPTGIFSAGAFPTSAASLGQLPFGPSRSRLTSASPLLGRGLPTTIAGTAGGDVQMEDLHLPPDLATSAGFPTDADFELFGAAAGVDTQTAEQSQWQRVALDGESWHFLEFVQNGIEEVERSRVEELGDGEGEGGCVEFDALLPGAEHSRVVAAQALLHVLSLGTKGVLRVVQEVAFGGITLYTVAGADAGAGAGAVASQ